MNERPAPDTLPGDVHPESRNRLPPLGRDDLDEAAKRLYDAHGGFAGPGRIRLYNPRMAEKLMELNNLLRFDSGLEPRLMELAILVAAREMDSRYEWYHHEPAALKAGLAIETIDVVRDGRPTTSLDEPEAALIDLGREALRDHRVSPETYARALHQFSAKLLVSYCAIIADYVATAIFLATFDMQLPQGHVSTLPI